MAFLIFDTDKQSTHSLRVQLNTIDERPVRELLDWNAFSKLKSKKIPPPDVIFFDQDGDPERVAGFRQELESYQGTSVVVILGTDPHSKLARKHDTYLRKPVFPRKLERSVVNSYALGQERRSVVGYIGESVPAGLAREVGRAQKLFKQFRKLDPEAVDTKTLSTLGAIIVPPGELSEADMELVNRLYKITSSSRVTIVGLGTTPEETFPLRSRADFFVGHEANWASTLSHIASYRLSRFASDLLLARAKAAIESGRTFKARLLLKKLLRQDAWNIPARVALAELEFSLSKFRCAGAIYRGILELNPCQPRPHLRLIEIERRLEGKPSAQTIARARSYCPNLKELQGMS